MKEEDGKVRHISILDHKELTRTQQKNLYPIYG